MTDRQSVCVVAAVDDDESVLRSIEYLLESADYSVRVFTSGQALLDSGCLPEIDCLISDIDMPGIDGFALLREIHVARPGLPTILITGFPDRLKRIPLPGEGQPRVFTKPFHGPALLTAIHDAIRNCPE